MKILVISRTPWRLDNSFGNTYSSIFSKIDDIEIAHIYLADGLPETEKVVKEYYQISESKIIKNFFKARTEDNSVGKRVYPDNDAKTELDTTVKVAQKKRWPIFYILRDFIWRYGNVNYKGMESFARDFHPDLIFAPLYYANYVSRTILRMQKVLNVPIVLECSLDVYSLKQVSFDPFYWINRFAIRGTIRKIINKTSLLYTISDLMKDDYHRMLGIPCKILYKFPDFTRKKSTYITDVNNSPRFLYTGNIGDGRWKSLSKLVEILKLQKYGTLDVYTATPITKDIEKELDVPGVSKIHQPVSQQEVIRLQGDADILVHVESFNLRNKLNVRYSISTKIMDYLCAGRTIFAIGPEDIASMDYLKSNNIALCANSINEIAATIKKMKDTPNIIKIMSNKGLDFLSRQKDVKEVQKEFVADLKKIARL